MPISLVMSSMKYNKLLCHFSSPPPNKVDLVHLCITCVRGMPYTLSRIILCLFMSVWVRVCAPVFFFFFCAMRRLKRLQSGVAAFLSAQPVYTAQWRLHSCLIFPWHSNEELHAFGRVPTPPLTPSDHPASLY